MSARSLPALLSLLLALAAVPVAAGTLYVPIVAPDAPGGGEYATRIWLTNSGSSDAPVSALFLRAASDGTRDRGQPTLGTVAAGSTLVYTPSEGSGMVELDVPAGVAVSAELRNTAVPGPREVYGGVPVVWSGNALGPGQTAILQGMRRTVQGVRSHLGLMNLGHEGASCDLVMSDPSGGVLANVPELRLPPLSHLLFEDALALVGEKHLGDVSVFVACDQTFYAYVALADAGVGEVVFQRPSPTGASTLEPPGQEDPPVSDGKTVVFSRAGVFHVPNKKTPTKIFDVAVPHSAYRQIVVDLDVTLSAWSYEPSKNHNVFWLHRGGNWDTPGWKWRENIVGYVNAFGPGKNEVATVHNLDWAGDGPYETTRKFTSRASWVAGKKHHVRFVYDAEGGTIETTIRRDGQVLASRSVAATTSLIHTPPSGTYMLYFGHEDARNSAGERPSYGWKYADLRVEFIP